MKKGHFKLSAVCCLLFAFFLWGCGAGPGSPGSDGSEKTGVILEASLTPTYLGANTYSVDVVQQICDAGPPPEYEQFADHGATATIRARLLNPNPPIPPGTLYIEKYTVEYRRSPDSIGAPPIETDTRYTTIVITPPLSGTGVATLETSLVLVEINRKRQYYTDILSGVYTSRILNNYTALYTFEGKNQYGTDFSFKAQTDFQIGSFDYCK